MALNATRFAVIDLPTPSGDVTAAFEALPQDPYTPGGHRSRRFSQFRMTYTNGSWALETLPHRPFIQSSIYNPLVGGVARFLEPLTIDPTPQIDAGAKAIPLDTDHPWQINVHQCRVVTGRGMPGISVPEGPHHDGHDFGMLAVFGRRNIAGGETQLIPNEGGEPFFRMTLEANQAFVYEDAAMLHYATDIEPLTPEGGCRDLWIVAFNTWDNRKYGREFEAAALASCAEIAPSS
jgi:hypothetical protein